MNKRRIWLAALVCFLLCATGVGAANMVPYNISELGMSISLPGEYNYVFTRDINEDDPILADWGMTKSEMFANDSLYLEAVTEDQNREIIVTMVESDWSKAYYDFNDIANEDLAELAETFLLHGDDSVNMKYTDYSLYGENDQAKFLKATGVFDNEESQGQVLQYVTVVNGKAYTITFNYYTGEIGDAQDDQSQQVVSSVTFDEIIQQERGEGKTVYIIIIGIMAAIIVALLLVIRRKNYTLGEHLKEEHNATDNAHTEDAASLTSKEEGLSKDNSKAESTAEKEE